MQLKCPACNASFSLDAAMTVGSARAALQAALSLSPLHPVLGQYLGMFRPAGRTLSWDRLEKLLVELQPMLTSETVTRSGITRPCPLAIWRQALERMVEQRDAGKLVTPLKSHGYLLEIAFASADHAAADAERRLEEERRRGTQRAALGTDHARAVERSNQLGQINSDLLLGLIDREEAERRATKLGFPKEAVRG